MLSVEQNSLPSLQQRELGETQTQQVIDEIEPTLQKQTIQKSKITPFKIVLSLALAFLLILGGYTAYSLLQSPPVKSQMVANHQNIITFAGSSSQTGKDSSTGSSTSKNSKGNGRPQKPSNPASKFPISSPINGQTGSGGDGQDPSDGDKNKKILDSDKNSDTGKSKGAKTTDQDSQSLQSEDGQELNTYGLMWPNRNQDGSVPLIGNKK